YIQYASQTTVALDKDTIVNIEMTRDVSYSLDATWSENQRRAIYPEESVTYEITITNTGNMRDSYTLTGKGVDFTYDLPDEPVTVDFGKTNNTVTVSITITAKFNAMVNHGAVTIDVQSTGSSSVRKSVEVKIDVLPVYEISAIRSASGSINGTSYYSTLELRNDGNIEDNYTLQILNANELSINGWNVTFQSNQGLILRTDDIEGKSSGYVNVSFSANRAVPTRNISAEILIVSNASSISYLASISPYMPDLKISDEGISVIGENIHSNDVFTERDMENIILMFVLLAIILSVFIIRKLKFGRFLR
ncbi:MAG: hypothetical protein OEV21_05160, partial [Thermoplasmata archaeon]|nr:hypothetical protein [Thermoplasmata archaeon]